MASNPHGFNNETEISNYLDDKKVSELNLSMKEFIKYICKCKGITFTDSLKIKSNVETNNKLKQDIYLYIENNIINVSIKMGSGNSVHQEKIEDFIEFIKFKCNASNEICNLWRFFIWADGTLDGTGSQEMGFSGPIYERKGHNNFLKEYPNGVVLSRFDTTAFKDLYPEKRKQLQDFVATNKEFLIERAIFVGKYNSCVDFIYHGTVREGRWISKKEVIEYLKNKQTSKIACLPVGGLTIQPWNVSLKGETGASEKKRGEIQLKYGRLQDDLDHLMINNSDTRGTFLGDLEEFGLSQVLNKNKNNSMWKVLFPDETNYSNYYAVKVSSNQLSRLSNKKVKPKSDAYIIKADLSKKYLLEREYVIEEKDLTGVTYSIVPESGISIKMKSSKNYTYQKFTENSFKEAFSNISNINFWLISLLIYSADSERYKNDKIITDLGSTMDAYLKNVNEIMNISLDNIHTTMFWNCVRRKAQDFIKNHIKSDKDLLENIFMGKHWFDSPYHANYIYEQGTLRENTICNFSITTGSGRSKGKYNIEIIPNK